MDVSAIHSEALAWKGEFAVLGGDWSPYFHDLIDLFGMERFMTLMVDAPDVIEAAVERITDYYLAVSRRIFEASAAAIDIFFIGNDFDFSCRRSAASSTWATASASRSSSIAAAASPRSSPT